MLVRPVGTGVSLRLADMMKLIAVFENVADAPKSTTVKLFLLFSGVTHLFW